MTMKLEAIKEELSKLRNKLSGPNLNHAQREDVKLQIKELEIMLATAIRAETIASGVLRAMNGKSTETNPELKPTTKSSGFFPSNR
ncbi:hypothetical protein [Marinagarivorans cellulosilyticus]|uniref:hypothetical protein n=1 Tax=Marinagarivorans cellulosilyticus TaxID=2721545 RepID=UPI001F31F46A|nr:hypothetical protein [Marinagarivorans cellulosilyticus]